MHLTLVLADFHPQAEEFSSSASHLPRLAGLEHILRFGSRTETAHSWRGWLAAHLGCAQATAWSPAEQAARSVDASLQQPWLATPVHLVAGLDHVRLHRAGLLRLDDLTLARLAREFDGEFAGAGVRLVPVRGAFVVEGLGARDAVTSDPARWLGASITAALAQGPGSAELRRLQAEMEMWLHEHPVNVARAGRRELPVTALWLWGAARPATVSRGEEPPPAARGGVVQLFADDATSAGIAAAAGVTLSPTPVAYGTLPRAAAGARNGMAVVLSAAARDERDAPLARLDERWLSPAIADLGAGRLRRLTLQAAGASHMLGPRSSLRVWRRAQPWWMHFS